MKHEKFTSVSTPGFSGASGLRGVGALDTAAHPAARAPDRWLLSVLQRQLRGARIRLTLWDGTSAYSSFAPPVGTVLVKDRLTLVRLLWSRHVAFGDAFSSGRLEVQGDLVECLEAVSRTSRKRTPSIGRRRWSVRGANTLDAARDNIHRHYDIGNDFYELWLDQQLVYTCAYFPSPAMSLEEAQVAKMDHVCRKLQLRPGEKVIEAGCGWGALALHMARQYGVSVRAFNISREQIAYARRRAEREGLADRVAFIEDDYRNITGTCDVFVSVGMLEHVGRDCYPSFGAVIHRILDPERGRGLLHFIGRNWPRPLNAWIRQRIFPGAEPPTLAEVGVDIFEPWDLSVLDVENLRLHYARTLEHWLARFEAAEDRVRQMFDDRFFRAWRLYLAGSQAGFTTGTMQLFQVTFARSHDSDIPWTRGTRGETYREVGAPRAWKA